MRIVGALLQCTAMPKAAARVAVARKFISCHSAAVGRLVGRR